MTQSLYGLIQKFANVIDLTERETTELHGLGEHLREFPAHKDVLPANPTTVFFLLEGIAVRYGLLPTGSRTILGFLVPGDFCSAHPQLAPAQDHPIASATPCTVACVPRSRLAAWKREFPRLATALERWCLVDHAIARRWLMNMAIPAERRLAHMICELHHRMEQAGQADQASLQLPFTQQELGEAAAVSTVHVNRSLQHLKELGLIRAMGRTVLFPDLAQLESFAGFDPTYLNPGREGRESVPDLKFG